MRIGLIFSFLYLTLTCYSQEVDFPSFNGDTFKLKQESTLKDAKFHVYKTTKQSGRRVYKPHPCLSLSDALGTVENFFGTYYNTNKQSEVNKLFEDGKTIEIFTPNPPLDTANHFALIHKLTFTSLGKQHAIVKYQKIINSEINGEGSFLLVKNNDRWYLTQNDKFANYQFVIGNIASKVFWELEAKLSKPEEDYLLNICKEVKEENNELNINLLANFMKETERKDPVLFKRLTEDIFEKK